MADAVIEAKQGEIMSDAEGSDEVVEEAVETDAE
jgi:hypothetical protein